MTIWHSILVSEMRSYTIFFLNCLIPLHLGRFSCSLASPYFRWRTWLLLVAFKGSSLTCHSRVNYRCLCAFFTQFTCISDCRSSALHNSVSVGDTIFWKIHVAMAGNSFAVIAAESMLSGKLIRGRHTDREKSCKDLLYGFLLKHIFLIPEY